MTIQAIKLSDNRTILELDTETGDLIERGGDSLKLTRGVEDTYALLKLLFANKDSILNALQKVRAQATKSEIRVDSRLDNMLSESGQSGYTSSITLDQELRGQGQTIKPTRGA
jgi:hypothetical protein